jgi:hypothetical protein
VRITTVLSLIENKDDKLEEEVQWFGIRKI